MANFLQKTKQPFGDLKLYSPDYSFLSTVYGTKQAEYDRGFNIIKSVYNSALNNSLTSSENESYRQEVFKKIQNSLKSVAGVDLSNPTNITRAEALLNPITEDKELAYDMAVTKFHDSQKQKMEMYKNSTDPKVRKLYNEDSRKDIQFAEDDLKQTKRGDGSIFKVQPREFVINDDVNEFLNSAAKEQGIKIHIDQADGRGYIQSITNGQLSHSAFTAWANAQMGDRFDRQFEVKGRVQAETMIRSEMANSGVSRNIAIQTVAKSIYQPLMEQISLQGSDAEESIRNIDTELEHFKRDFPNGIPKSKLKDYQKLLQNKQVLSNVLDDSRDKVSSLQNDGEGYVAANLYSMFNREAKTRIANNWAKTYSDATADITLKSDDVVLKKWEISSRESIASLDRRSRENIAALDSLDKQKDRENAFKIASLKGKTKLVKNEDGTYSEVAEKDGILHPVGPVTDTKTNFTAVELLQNQLDDNNAEIFNNTFGMADMSNGDYGGLINLIISKEHSGAYIGTISKLKSIAEGQGGSLSPTEDKLLRNYANKIGIKQLPQNLNNRENASSILSNFTIATVKEAKKVVQMRSKNVGYDKIEPYIKVFSNVIGAMDNAFENKKEISLNYARVYDFITDQYGNLKPGYEGAIAIGRLPSGRTMYDLSKVDDVHRQKLNFAFDDKYRKQLQTKGMAYNADGITGPELFYLLDHNKSNMNADTFNALKSLGESQLEDVLGSNVQFEYHPLSKTVTVNLHVDPSSKMLKGDNGVKLKTETIPITLTYDEIRANPLLTRLNEKINENTVSPKGVGEFSKFISDPKATITSPGYLDPFGVGYSATGGTTTSGVYGINLAFKYFVPNEKESNGGHEESHSSFIPIPNPTNPGEYEQVKKIINQFMTSYRNGRIASGNGLPPEELIPYNYVDNK